MISYKIFEDIVDEKIGRKIRSTDDNEQYRAIKSSVNSSLFMVAGPGSGKTTVMVLKILKFIFVDGVDPASIVATTFTVKAASELSSRIYDWGNIIIKSSDDDDLRHFIDNIDLNQIIIGTLDSICFEILNRFREPGMAPPVLVDDFVANSLMLRFGLFKGNRHEDEDLENFLKKIAGSPRRLSAAKKTELLLELKSRFYEDNIDFDIFCEKYDHVGAKVACDAIGNYIKTLKDREILDYSTLENEFLVNIKEGKLNKFLNSIEVVLVDEYQDSNSLQERIYCDLAKASLNNGGGIIVVGDDDQSLYRFRGATVDLFVNFISRFENRLNVDFDIIKLSNNYRSTEEIVNFCNTFVNLDDEYKNARVANKNDIISARKKEYVDYPILGIFRDDLESLSDAISNFIYNILNKKLEIERDVDLFIDPNNGSVNDISFLFSSPNEFNSYNGVRLPHILKKDLSLLNSPIKIFNPRGQSLEKVEDVSILCGLMLECIDPVNDIQEQIDSLPSDALFRLKIWREMAYDYIADSPKPNDPLSLREFVDAWQDREPKGRKNWKKSVPLLELAYKLIRWIPRMQNDVEGLVYLEAITKTINQTALFSNYGGSIDFSSEEDEERSIKEAIWSIFVPLATGAIDIDEDLLENLPKDRLNFMSIHQSKGLEFPLVIVDVGSEYKTNHASQRFKRFPKEGNKDCRMENVLRKYSKSLQVPSRSELDRSFDDLIRKYFVAFSRAQDVLVLVGLTSNLEKKIPNIALGWDRNGEWKEFNKIKYI